MRATALGALERLGALTDADIEQALTDPQAIVRRRAAEVAARHPGVTLTGTLADPDPTVVEMAAWACGEHEARDPAVVSLLAALAVSNDDPLVREAAVAALGAIGDELGLPAILAATTDKAAVRRRAVLALAPFEGDAVDEALERARTRPRLAGAPGRRRPPRPLNRRSRAATSGDLGPPRCHSRHRIVRLSSVSCLESATGRRRHYLRRRIGTDSAPDAPRWSRP